MPVLFDELTFIGSEVTFIGSSGLATPELQADEGRQVAIPALSAHLSDVEFMYSDNKYYELCGQMGHLIGPSGIGKAQLTHLVEAIMRPFREHDESELKKLLDLGPRSYRLAGDKSTT